MYKCELGYAQVHFFSAEVYGDNARDEINHQQQPFKKKISIPATLFVIIMPYLQLHE